MNKPVYVEPWRIDKDGDAAAILVTPHDIPDEAAAKAFQHQLEADCAAFWDAPAYFMGFRPIPPFVMVWMSKKPQERKP